MSRLVGVVGLLTILYMLNIPTFSCGNGNDHDDHYGHPPTVTPHTKYSPILSSEKAPKEAVSAPFSHLSNYPEGHRSTHSYENDDYKGGIPPNQTFDLMGEDVNNVSQHYDGHLIHKTYKPDEDARIACITEGTREVWRVSGDERCTFIQYYIGNTRLISLEINRNGNFMVKHFEKMDGKWSGMRLGEFSRKLTEMMGTKEIMDETIS